MSEFLARYFLKAARALTGINQLQQLQEYFEAPLFETRGRKKGLSLLGKAVLEAISHSADSMVRSVNSLEKSAQFTGPKRYEICGRGELLKFSYKDFSTNSGLYFKPMPSEQVKKAILENSIDIGITHYIIDTAGYIRKKLFTDSRVLTIPHTLARNFKSLESWLNQERVHSYAGYSNGDEDPLPQIIGYLKLPIRFNPGLVFPDWDFLENRVEDGLNWAILPSRLVNRTTKNYFYEKVSFLPATTFWIYYKRELRSRSDWMPEIQITEF